MSLVNLNLNLNLDRTANKIAFCSAVVAGTIYVGYSVRHTFSLLQFPKALNVSLALGCEDGL